MALRFGWAPLLNQAAAANEDQMIADAGGFMRNGGTDAADVNKAGSRSTASLEGQTGAGLSAEAAILLIKRDEFISRSRSAQTQMCHMWRDFESFSSVVSHTQNLFSYVSCAAHKALRRRVSAGTFDLRCDEMHRERFQCDTSHMHSACSVETCTECQRAAGDAAACHGGRDARRRGDASVEPPSVCLLKLTVPLLCATHITCVHNPATVDSAEQLVSQIMTLCLIMRIPVRL